MSDRTEVAQNLALAAVAALVAMVLAGVLALAIAVQARGKPANRPQIVSPAAATPAQSPDTLSAPVDGLVFETGSAALPADAGELLARVADAARGQAGATVVISAFFATGGDPARHTALARERALAVRHALEANGVAPSQLQIAVPAAAEAEEGDARRADRVVLTLQ